jgi:centrosomal protein CEP57
LGSQLSTAETKCQLLEKQLDYMRTMLHSVEKDRFSSPTHPIGHSIGHSVGLPESELPHKFKVQAERLSDLEREHLKLTATQNLAEVGEITLDIFQR